jgi:glycine cleavage system H protein
MVAILVVLTITVCLLVDWILQLVQAKREKRRSGGAKSEATSTLSNPFAAPNDVFFHPGHAWVRNARKGRAKVGIDGLIGFLIGEITRVELPSAGTEVREGDIIALLRQGQRDLVLRCPINGRIVEVNRNLFPDGRLIRSEPYGAGWVCEIEPLSLSADLAGLMTGDAAATWHQTEARRIVEFLSRVDSGDDGGGGRKAGFLREAGADTLPMDGLMLRGFMEVASDDDWHKFQDEFLDTARGGDDDQ